MDDVIYEAVTLASSSPVMLADVGRKARRTRLTAHYFRPDTDTPPFPGVVVCQRLGGLKDPRKLRYGRFLAQNGCAAIVIDSFAARGYRHTPEPIAAIPVTEGMMLADAFTSLAWLARRPEVDAARISSVGFSYGGTISLLAAYQQIARLFAPEGERFRAHVSYYAPAFPRLVDNTTTGAPIAILNGALDDNVNRVRLHLIAEDLQSGGSPVENVTLENTYARWDSGRDVRPFERFNTHALATQIRPDNTMIHEPSGMVVRGLTTRLAMVARSMSLKGFDCRDDAKAMQTTDQILIRYAAGRHALSAPRGPARASDRRSAVRIK